MSELTHGIFDIRPDFTVKLQQDTSHWVVIKSPFRHYGYSIRDIKGLATYATGPGCSCGWYKYKYAAQQRCDELNKK